MVSNMNEKHFAVFDKEFHTILTSDSTPVKLAGGLRFTEGPAWSDALGCLLFSDIPADTIYRWSEAGGLATWRCPSSNANGNTIDARGRLVTCEHGSRRVTCTDSDGSIITLSDKHDGKRLNSPNDAVVKSDGTIWFTDPPYGIKKDLVEQDANYVFRLDPGSSEAVPVCGTLQMPNGLCFSPDESLLYVADSSLERHHIRVFEVTAENTLQGGEVFAAIEPGVPDGMRTDTCGRLYSTAGDGVHVFSPGGKLLGKILVPEVTANCEFGGTDRSTLFMTASTSLYCIRLAAEGCR